MLDRLRGWLASPWLQVGLTFALACGLAIVSHRLWQADLAYPFVYSGDGFQYLMYAKSIHDNGWLLENGYLGAPFGLYMYDWAEGGWPSLVGLRALDAATGNWVLSFNLFYLLGYPLAALAALWALRRLAVAPALAIALAALYAIVPYHLDRSENHYILSLYYGLPPMLSYAATTAAGRAPIPLRPGRLGWRVWLRRTGPALAAAALAGIMSAYYVVFAGLIMLAGTAFGWLRTRRLGLVVGGLLMSAVLGATFVLQYSPTLAYRLANGPNHDVGQRYLGEVENYPLKLADLLLPVEGHRIGALAALRQRYMQFGSPGQPGLALGTIGSIGLLLVLGGFVAAAARRARRGGLASRLAPLGWLAASALAIGMLGGGATLLSFLVGPYLRAWDRIAIVIAFFALAGVGLVLTRLRARLPRGWRAATVAIVAAVLVVAGTLDQATPTFVRPYQSVRQAWDNDARFVARIDQLLPAGAMVYHLPFITFPETRRGESGSTDTIRFYFHSTDLRWAGGMIKGRDPGWQVIQQVSSLDQVLTLVRAVGFAGLTADRIGYLDVESGLDEWDAVSAQLTSRLGPPAAMTDDGRVAFFVLEPSDQQAQMSRDALDPVWMRWASGFDLMYQRAGHITHHARARATVELRNLRAAARPVTASFELWPMDQPWTVELRWPDGVVEQVQLGSQPVTHRRSLMLPAGRNELRLVVADAPPRGFTYTLADLAVVDDSLAHLLP